MRPMVEQQMDPDECVDVAFPRYCEASICTTDEMPTFASIHWKCVEEKNATQCAERLQQIYEKNGNLKNVTCQCHYGEEGEDFGNKNFTLPPPANPADKVPMCKIGMIHSASKRGLVEIGVCKKDHHYCFAANCSIKVAEDERSLMAWSCAKSNDGSICKEIEQNGIGDFKDVKMSCECLFGDRNVDLANEMMLVYDLFPLMDYGYWTLELDHRLIAYDGRRRTSLENSRGIASDMGTVAGGAAAFGAVVGTIILPGLGLVSAPIVGAAVGSLIAGGVGAAGGMFYNFGKTIACDVRRGMDGEKGIKG
ncbi:hypothetical protein niasHT_023424 [Heterodera trifolii]|uniref:Uncharacterized protein n=1 Tax=Heterodera trifolii TaxID=157864 RepID=A0ABD2K493_9BILA